MKWDVTKQHEGLLLRDYLLKVIGISRRMLTAIKFDEGKLLVNNMEVNVRYRLMARDQIKIILPQETRSKLLVAENISIDIVYEDEHIIVINKPPFIATIPSRDHPSHTLANGIINYYDNHNIPYTVHIVTRLDRDTSGLMLIAKHRYSHSILFHDQQEHNVNRGYLAMVSGNLHNERGTITDPIARDPESIITRRVSQHGKRAITHYQVREQLDALALLEIHLETGRTHQIRVHFSSIGHPLIGDDLYGGSMETIQRQALHCHQLSFDHPIKKERMQFEIPLAKDLKQAWEAYK
ncbi:RluA family pseudouridine synthase [Gracilibacillus kekensis]|uniref:Pseudouridine synthase n=1 Tax=Gracilibacillus kekensis TaxID=1027249 RepID=A0A1M7IL15_9BACI|nr:RluA family pseudouridine synthase [Gracilibacillus kekensis]SHM41293.1 23S rRNA pseudouridine1911/1915/1917 synthase [Gracilibacillus kekensis]